MASTLTLTMSPLNPSATQSPFARPATKRQSSFPSSRPLRPFSTLNPKPVANKGKPIKIIEPPKGGFTGFFVVNMTQEELSRR